MLDLDLEARDTIAAIASPAGPAVRVIVRVSGPAAIGVATRDLVPGPRATGRAVRVAGQYRLDGLAAGLPASVVIWPGPRTYTGEDLVEVHTIGSPPLLDRLLGRFLAQGARVAEPGEFTLRAFLSGRLDLTRAEAVLGVVHARTSAQLEAALEQLAGGLAVPLTALRDRLLDTLAHLEAGLDFVDEADVDPLARSLLASELGARGREVAALAMRLDQRDRALDRPRVVLTGPPNAGKSSLFNALAGADHAIVSEQPGTTRDYLTATIEGRVGPVFELVDTAGEDRAESEVEAEAQAFRAHQSRAADLILVCRGVDDGGEGPVQPESGGGMGSGDGEPMPSIHVATRCDLGRPVPGWIETSARTGQGIEALRDSIGRALEAQETDRSPLAHTGARCRESLDRAAGALERAARAISDEAGDELVAIDLRAAIDGLGQVVGQVFTDDVLDRIFRRFCIGK